MLLTKEEWMVWFEQTKLQASHLVRTQRVLRAVGLCDDPETVIEISRFILADPDAPAKLRQLADEWERVSRPVKLVTTS